ncbi:MAG: 2-oxo acid dehydrogenase subunit E2 [Cyclobacteriaceae bacterium]|nr:2-oxo acid dehydrogenase subunit E2 [Cyclobacteriaceae bacterium]
MALVEIVMPKMGESVMEATILSWLKKEGDTIEQDESVLEVSTDKVDTEVPSTHSGILKQILAREGEVVEVGKPIGIITTDSGDEQEKGNGQEVKSIKSDAIGMVAESSEQPIGVVDSAVSMQAIDIPRVSADRFYSPLVRNIAKKEGITLEELDRLPGTGKEGRVTKADIISYLKLRASSAQHTITRSASPVTVGDSDEIVEMDRMRKLIAERMLDSKRISAHVTSFVEADVTNVVRWREKVKDRFLQREGGPLTFTPLFIEAVVKALLDYPNMNIQVDGTKIIRKKDINIGMAVALPSGNLIVPVIHRADQLSLAGLAGKVNELAQKARNNELTPDELSGGTYTISNVGSFGNVMGTPIIVQPQVGILALGTIRKIPAVIETPEGDLIGIRQKMFLSHSYDHRVIDGALGGMMVRRVADYLEDFDINRTI